MLPVDIRFQSQQQLIIIHYTHSESLELSSCSNLGVVLQLLTDFGKKSGDRIATRTNNIKRVEQFRPVAALCESVLHFSIVERNLPNVIVSE